MKILLLLFTLMAGLESATAQTMYTKWKQVQDPTTLKAKDVVVIVDLTTSSAMRNNPKYDDNKNVSKEAPASTKVTLKEELDRLTCEIGDTLVWEVDRPDSKYTFFIEKAQTHYLFFSDQNLRVGYVSTVDAWKSKFDLDRGLLYMPNVETGPSETKDFHVGLKVASGIQAMMSGNVWDLMPDSVSTSPVDTFVNKDIAATKMAFFKKEVTDLPDPTFYFPGHDYEADVKDGTFVSPKAVVDEDENAQITYWSSNDLLASIDPTTGIVTLKGRGTVRIYAQVQEKEGRYDNFLTSYVLRIDDTSENVKGCRTNPFTVAEAIEYAKSDHADEAANGVCYFVKGIVSSVGGEMAGMEGMEDMMDMMMEMMGNMGSSEEMGGFDMTAMMSMFMGEQEPGTVTYTISDNGVNSNSLSINNGRGLLLGNKLSDITEDSLSVGDWVTVCGPLEYSEDGGMMAMFGGGNKEKKEKMPRINYMSEHMRNLTTEDINLYFEQEKKAEELFSIKDLLHGTLVTKNNAGDLDKPYTTLISSDEEVAYWKVNSEGTDSVLVPKKEGLITMKVKAPVIVGMDTVYMERSFIVNVRDRDLLAAGTMVGDFQLVTDETSLADGDKLILVATIDNKPKVLVKSSGKSGGMMAMFGGGGSNAKDVTIDGEGKIKEIPDITQILTLEDVGEGKWLLQAGKTADYDMTYLYISDTDGGSTTMIPGMGSSGAKLKTGALSTVGDSCQVTFTFPSEKNDSVQIQFNFADRQNEKEETVKAKNVIRFEKGMMSSSFGGFEPESEKATLPRLYRLVQADEYPVTISDALWATIVSSYDVTLPEGLTAYVVKEVTDTKASLQNVTDKGGLKAGEPYLLNAASAGTYTLTRASASIEAADVNLLQVSGNGIMDGVYVLADKGEGAGFYKWSGGLLGAGRVYLKKTGAASRAFIPFGFDEENTTGIDALAGMKGKKRNVNVVYDLQGRRVNESRLPKGVYILNKEKFVIK